MMLQLAETPFLSKKKKGGLFKFAKKLALAPMRRAYRTLVALNVRGVATKMKKAIEKAPQEVEKKWDKLGGKYSELVKSVTAGAKRKRLLDLEDANTLSECANAFPAYQQGIKRTLSHSPQFHYMSEGEQLGAVQIAAVLAAAVPVFLALAPLMKKTGADKEGGSDLANVVDEARSAATAAGLLPAQQVDPTQPGNEEGFDKQRGADDSPKKDGNFLNNIPKPILYGGIALGALVLLRKK